MIEGGGKVGGEKWGAGVKGKEGKWGGRLKLPGESWGKKQEPCIREDGNLANKRGVKEKLGLR